MTRGCIGRRLLALGLVAALPLTAQAQDRLNSAIWWNPAESGWGLFISDQGNVLAPFWFTHDADGEPTWFLAPTTRQADGSYRGDIQRYTGVPFAQIAGQASDPPQTIGQATLRFNADATLRFDYTVGSHSASKSLSRYNFGGKDVVCTAAAGSRASASNYSDLWWNPNQSGWGVHIAHVDDALYATWYSYDDDREAVFLLGSTVRQADGSFRGALHRSRNGTAFTRIDGAPPSTGMDEVGVLTIRFSDGEHATFDYTVGNVTQSRTITRMQFGSIANSCSVQPYATVGDDGASGGTECLPPYRIGDEREVRVTSTSNGTTSTLTRREKIVGTQVFQGQNALVEETSGTTSAGTGVYARTFYAADGGRKRASFGAQSFDPRSGALLATSVNDPLRIEQSRFWSSGQEEQLQWTVRATAQGFTTDVALRNRWKLLGRESVSTPAGTFDACKFELAVGQTSAASGVTTRTELTGTAWTSADFGLLKQQTSGSSVASGGGFSVTVQQSETLELLSARSNGRATP